MHGFLRYACFGINGKGLLSVGLHGKKSLSAVFI